MKKLVFWGADEDDDHLVRQILRGEKTATCTPAAWYYDNPDEEPTSPGDLVGVWDLRGNRRCTVRIDRVYEIPFGEVGDDVVKGEVCATLEDFKAVHHKCWDDDFEKAGMKLDDRTVVVVEQFTLIS
jgi:uncharacterized protein YhfF